MHLATFLLNEGMRVSIIDTDGRQGTVSKYIENRLKFLKENHLALKMPQLVTVTPRDDYTEITNHISEIDLMVEELCRQNDAIIIDTPGAKNYLFETAHQLADTLITPIGDSLIDLNVLSYSDNTRYKAGHYAQFIWDIKKYRAQKGKLPLNWIVVGNRVSALNSRNKTLFFEQLKHISGIYGFRVADGIKERVIYKELFWQGLTVLDLNTAGLKNRLSLSHLAAKQEIRALAEFICPQS